MVLRRGYGRYGARGALPPEVAEAMRRAEDEARHQRSGLWTRFPLEPVPLDQLDPEAQRRAAEEHNRRIEEAQAGGAAGENQGPSSGAVAPP